MIIGTAFIDMKISHAASKCFSQDSSAEKAFRYFNIYILTCSRCWTERKTRLAQKYLQVKLVQLKITRDSWTKARRETF